MSKTKRGLRPRLEVSVHSEVSGEVSPHEDVNRPIALYHDEYAGMSLNLRDAKRLHAFLARAIAYLGAADSRSKATSARNGRAKRRIKTDVAK